MIPACNVTHVITEGTLNVIQELHGLYLVIKSGDLLLASGGEEEGFHLFLQRIILQKIETDTIIIILYL